MLTVYPIYPLTFLQVYQSAGIVIDALLEHDVTMQEAFGTSRAVRRLFAATGVPLYYHLATSGYGAFDGDKTIGWMYLRGWHQVLYVDALAVLPECRRRGIGRALLTHAETLARELRREWLGLTVSVDNLAAVQLYEREGYMRGHWRVMQAEAAPKLGAATSKHVELRPLIGPAAGRAFREFTQVDMTAWNGEAAGALSRLLERDRYRKTVGQHWLVHFDGKPAAYLHRFGPRSRPTIYVAAAPEWWGTERLLDVVKHALHLSGSELAHVYVRLASSGHHDAARPALESLGLAEQPSATTKMVKRLSK